MPYMYRSPPIDLVKHCFLTMWAAYPVSRGITLTVRNLPGKVVVAQGFATSWVAIRSRVTALSQNTSERLRLVATTYCFASLQCRSGAASLSSPYLSSTPSRLPTQVFPYVVPFLPRGATTRLSDFSLPLPMEGFGIRPPCAGWQMPSHSAPFVAEPNPSELRNICTGGQE